MSGLLHSEIMYYCKTHYMQQFSLVYNKFSNLFAFLEPVDEPRPTYACGQFMQGTASLYKLAALTTRPINLSLSQFLKDGCIGERQMA